jgi:hypothetical protein
MGQAHRAYGDNKNGYKIFIGAIEGTKPFVGKRHKCEDMREIERREYKGLIM